MENIYLAIFKGDFVISLWQKFSDQQLLIK